MDLVISLTGSPNGPSESLKEFFEKKGNVWDYLRIWLSLLLVSPNGPSEKFEGISRRKEMFGIIICEFGYLSYWFAIWAPSRVGIMTEWLDIEGGLWTGND